MNAGLRQIEIPWEDGARAFAAIIQYPTTDAPQRVALGPYQLDATPDATPAAGSFPLCVISHGGGGSHLLYRSIGSWLSTHGIVVISVEHPGDNRNDRSLSNTDRAAIDRPRHVSLAIDAVLADPILRRTVDHTRIAVVGHSMGGYTALALVGGRPWSRSGERLPVAADARVRAAVLLAPSTNWFLAPDALAAVTVPLLVLAGEHDEVTPASQIRQALTGLPANAPVTFEVIGGAGHFAFITPFPAHMRRPDFAPAADPPGFDRDALHRELPDRILRFLRDALEVSGDLGRGLHLPTA